VTAYWWALTAWIGTNALLFTARLYITRRKEN
jgi:hypothetical protein